MRFKVLLGVICLALVSSPCLTAAEPRTVAGSQEQPATDRGWLGFGFHYKDETEDRTFGQPWLYVHLVVPSGPADAAGLETGDVIIEINGKPFRFDSEIAILDAFAEFRPQEKVSFTLLRGQDRKVIEMVAGTMSKEYLEAWQSVYDALKAREEAEAEKKGLGGG